MLKKRFSFLVAGWLPLLMGVLLIGALGATTAQAQTAVTDLTIAAAQLPAPVAGQTAVTSFTDPAGTPQWTATVAWAPALTGGVFAAGVTYTANITLTAETGYTFTGVAADAFTVSSGTATTNPAGSGTALVVSADFAATAATITDAAIAGVTAPVAGATAVTTTTADAQFTGAVSWSPALTGGVFAPNTTYTATITLTPAAGFTAYGVAADFFTVAGATATNSANSGTVSAVFPATSTIAITAIGAITGGTTAQVGVQLTAGALTPSGATATYQWQSSSTAGGTYTAIAGATSSTYTPVAADADMYLEVVATGSGGYSASVTSAPTAAVLSQVSHMAVAGVTAPVTGATAVTAITADPQFTGTVSWSPALSGGQFDQNTSYTATITLTAATGYSFYNLAANVFTVAGAAVVTNPAGATAAQSSMTVTATFPATGAGGAISIAAIGGVTVPVLGATPVTTVTATSEYTGTVSWSPSDATFQPNTSYTATITLTPKAGYTVTGVTANFFTVAGAAVVTNPANSGVVTAVFPATGGLTAITPGAISGVTAPVNGATAVTTVTGTHYSGTVSWSPALVGGTAFGSGIAYTATISLTAASGYTFSGDAANSFTVAGATATNPAGTTTTLDVSAVFPATATTISNTAIAGLTVPVVGEIPVSTITADPQFTGTVTWTPTASRFAASTSYTATVTVTPTSGYTLTGVSTNQFTVVGATSTTNNANSGVVTVVFPATGASANPVSASFTVDTLAVQLQNKALNKQDSTKLSTPIEVQVNNPAAGDYVAFTLDANFRFAKAGPYYVDTLKSAFSADSARVNKTMDTLYVKINSNTTASSFDSMSVAGVYVVPTTSAVANRYGIVSNIAASYIHAGALVGVEAPEVKALKLLPGAFYQYAASPTTTHTTIMAGDTALATATNVTLTLQDYFANPALDSTVTPTVKASLTNTNPLHAGNGTLLRGGYTIRTYTYSANTIKVNVGYTKTEPIYFAFIAPSDTVFSSAITVNPGTGRNVSAAVATGSSDTLKVGGSSTYNVTVTDQYFNPVRGAIVSAKEATTHGGTFTPSPSGPTNVSGVTQITFQASNSFVGADTLQFTDTTTVNHAILINAGTVAGVILDYSGTATGAPTMENIAAGTQVYVRAYLRDSYGNPINATDTSEVAFAINSATKTHGGALMASGKALSSIPASQASVTFAKDLVSPVVAISIPYTVSDTSSNTDAITATTKTAGYTAAQNITVRSNVPAKMKGSIHMIAGSTDSSVVASAYANKVVYQDTLMDAYGNLVMPPSSSYKIAPTLKSYGVVFMTNGTVKINRGMRSAKDTVSVDTVTTYTAAGLVSDTVASGKTAGIDNVTTWAVADSAVTSTAPIYVTPGTFAKLVIIPSVDTTTVAGKMETFMAEKQDAYGNHIDWGLAGGELRGNTGSITKPTAAEMTTDSTGVVTNWSILQSRTGAKLAVASKPYVGKASTVGASIGGSLDFAFNYTTYAASADTAKIRVVLAPAPADTVLIRSISTTLFGSYKLALSDTAETAGQPITLTVTPLDTNGNIIYTYNPKSVMLTLNHTSVMPDTSKDSTYYFTYTNLKNGKTVKTTGYIPDSIFASGTTSVVLHKFWADQDSMETITVADTAANVSSTSKTFEYTPASSKAAYGKWMVKVNTDTVMAGNPVVTFTVTPRDQYYNVNYTDTTIVNITTSASSGSYNFGSNPKVITGPTTITGVLTGGNAALTLEATVFNSDNTHIYGVSATKNLVDGVQELANNLPKKFALDQNYPNPFNPTTTIKYDVPKMASVRITIYDILGREVRTLVSNGNVAPGRYSVVWNGMNNAGQQVSSGVYFYRMQAGSFIQMKKMLLLK